MLGLILIYFVGKAFYDLAGLHGRHQWGYGILGVVSYYGGIYLGIFLIGIVLAIVDPEAIENISDVQATLMGIPIGVVTCWLTYSLLKKSWSKPKEISKHTLDSDLVTPNPNRYNQDERP
ncbi:MAG: hypothetical protein WDO15_15470 [Bacteroidota bacterium]